MKSIINYKLMEKYKIVLDQNSVHLIIKALDLYSRIGMGQFHLINDHPTFQKHLAEEFKCDDGKTDYTKYHEARKSAERYLTIARNYLYNDSIYPQNGSWGIHNKKVDDSCRQAFDIKQILRHEFWDGKSHTVDSSVHLSAKNKVICSIDKCLVE